MGVILNEAKKELKEKEDVVKKQKIVKRLVRIDYLKKVILDAQKRIKRNGFYIQEFEKLKKKKKRKEKNGKMIIK